MLACLDMFRTNGIGPSVHSKIPDSYVFQCSILGNRHIMIQLLSVLSPLSHIYFPERKEFCLHGDPVGRFLWSEPQREKRTPRYSQRLLNLRGTIITQLCVFIPSCDSVRSVGCVCVNVHALYRLFWGF